MRPRLLAAAAGVLLAAAAPAAAQALDPGPPGPYVVDLRGALTQLPSAFILLPLVPTATEAPGSAAGVVVGAHVYPLQVGPIRFGMGADVLHARGAAVPPRAEGTVVNADDRPEVAARLTAVAPQLSMNFGSEDGWSYLSAGIGWGRLEATLTTSDVSVPVDVGWGAMLNWGGGARWFLNSRVAFGFDVRAHQFQQRPIYGGGRQFPRTTFMALAVGASIR